MKKPSLLILSGLWILASGFSIAQTQPLTQEERNTQLHLQAQPHFQRLPTGEKMFSWLGQSGFSYFIQASPDLLDWTWAPNIEAGIDAPMSYEVDGPTASGFFRLIRTDQTAADLDAADFDGDGFSNAFELTPRPRPGGIIGFSGLNPNIQTSPLKKDTDADGLDDKWEEENGFDPTDNGSRFIDNGPNGDPDNDGVTNLNEQRLGTQPKGNATSTDSDEDGTLDFEDAVPGDNLVSWKRTPESSYALIEIETTTTDSSAQDLNDKGEVLFSDGIWAGGTWIPKATPEITGILPGSDGIGYNVSFSGWEFFNNDRKLLQKGRVHPTGGAGVDSSAPSPVFWNEGTSSPSLVYETANLWDTPYWYVSPLGVSTAGFMIVRASNPGGTIRLERFDPSGALAGSMDGSEGYHPSNGNWGHADITGTGWVSSNLSRPASNGQPSAHKVGLWDASNTPVTLPTQAEGWGYPVHTKDLPNGKVVLTAGAYNGTTINGRVFLPNPTGQFEYATKLADKNIELFAGDGSALTSDNKLWRNGDLIPMADLCPRYKELLQAGNTIHPLRSNDNGTYLVQVQSPTGAATAALLLPIEVRGYATKEVGPCSVGAVNGLTVSEKERALQVDTTDDTGFKTETKKKLKIVQWGDNYIFNPNNNSAFEHTKFKEDVDVFRVRLPDLPIPAGSIEHRIKITTLDKSGAILDSGAEVDLNIIRTNPADPNSPIKFHETAALSLVPDDADDDDFAVEGKQDGALGDRTYRAVLGGKVRIEWLTAPGSGAKPVIEMPVPAERIVTIQSFLLKDTTTAATANLWFSRARKIYSAVAVDLIFRDPITIDPLPTGVNLDNGFDVPIENAAYLSEMQPETIALMKDLRCKVDPDVIPVFIVNELNPANQGVTNIPSFMAPGSAGYGGAIFMNSGHSQHSAFSHELAHVLLDAGHDPSPDGLWGSTFRDHAYRTNIWFGKQSPLNPWWESGIKAHRRLYDTMRSRIWKSPYAKLPTP